jgi:hypothetical protein
MSMTVHLPDSLAAVLEAEAARRGQTPDEVATDLLAERLPARRARPSPNGVQAAAGLRQHVLHDNGWSRRGNRSPECPDHS